MNCPVCNVELQMAERQGIEIDYCPKCRGVWLDRGELDKIIERSASIENSPSSHASFSEENHKSEHGQKKKKGSFLSELFELGG